MQARWSLSVMKLKLSLRSLGWLFRRWRYTLLAVVAATAFFELVYWLFDLSALSTILFSSQLSIAAKFAVLISPLEAIASVNGTPTIITMLALALIQGVTIAALSYAIRHQPKVDSKLLGGSTLLGLLAVIGLGCPACGTSLVTPVVALFVSGSAVTVSESITVIAVPLALIIGLYGLYVLGLRVATVRAHQLANDTSSQIV